MRCSWLAYGWNMYFSFRRLLINYLFWWQPSNGIHSEFIITECGTKLWSVFNLFQSAVNYKDYTNSKYFIAPDNKITMKLNCNLQNQPERLAAIYSSHKHGPHWFNIDTGSSFSSASVTFKIRCFLSSVLFPAFSMSWLRENRHSYMSKYKFTHFVEANLPCWSSNTAFDNWHSRVCKTVVVSTSGSLIRLT